MIDAGIVDGALDHGVIDAETPTDGPVPISDGAAGMTGGAAGTAGSDAGDAAPFDAGMDGEVFGAPCDCAPFSFVHQTNQASALVQFGCCTYQPKCLRVSVGTEVSWMGPFGSHPLSPSVQTDVGNPIQDTASGDAVSFTFDTPGTYGYLCSIHGYDSPLGGMCGVIEVVP
jgi:plastocyanin